MLGMPSDSHGPEGAAAAGAQGPGVCRGACLQLFNGRACFQCHDPSDNFSYAIDLGNAQCALSNLLLYGLS